MIWHIVGNGPEPAIPTDLAENLVVFNHGYGDLTHACRIINSRLSGDSRALIVSGHMPFGSFDVALTTVHSRLQPDLRAYPSSGLCCVMAMLEAGLPANIRAMNLLPGLLRQARIEPRQPMPAYFHNWLAERRQVMHRIAKIHWPQFILEPLMIADSVESNPYVLLMELSGASHTSASKIIKMLERTDPECWLTLDNGADDARFDSLFYLSRNQSSNPNWWLFDNAATASMHQIQHQLAWAQQERFFAKKASSAKSELIRSDGI